MGTTENRRRAFASATAHATLAAAVDQHVSPYHDHRRKAPSMEWISSPEAWIALLTLTSLEIVLGIDNIIFISILSGRLPAARRARARTIEIDRKSVV